MRQIYLSAAIQITPQSRDAKPGCSTFHNQNIWKDLSSRVSMYVKFCFDFKLTKEVPDGELAPRVGVKTSHEVGVEQDAEGWYKWNQRNLEMSCSIQSQFKDANLECNGADRLRLPSDDNCEDDKEKTEDQEYRCLKCRVSVSKISP